jgi:hypothetical protein
MHTCAQNAVVDSTRGNAYKTFIGRILGLNGSALAPSFSLNLTPPTPALSGVLPIYPFKGGPFKAYTPTGDGVYDPYRRHIFYLGAIATLGANNGYTSISKGTHLQSNWQAGVAMTFLLHRIVKFYTAEVNKILPSGDFNPNHLSYIRPVDKMPISQASHIFFSWLNVNATFGQSNIQLFDTTYNKPFSAAVYPAKQNSFTLSANFNIYWFPDRIRLPRLTMYAQIGINYVSNANNIDSLGLDNVTLTNYAISGNTIIQHNNTTAAYDSVSFKRGYCFSVPFQYTFLINSVDHSFYIGFGIYNNISIPQKNGMGPDVFKLNPSDDIGVTMNLPVTMAGGSNTAANFQLKFILKDISQANNMQNIDRTTYRKQSFNVGFTVAVPLLISHKRTPDAGGN